MEIKNDAKSEEELTSQFKIGMSNLTNFDSSTQKTQKILLSWVAFYQCTCLISKSTRKLCLIALNIDAKFEGKLTFAFKNDMRNLRNFHQST